MEKNQKGYLAKFEVLSETKTGSLTNGYSTVIGIKGSSLSQYGGAASINGYKCQTTNNCSGGNCVSGCGGGGGVIII